MDASLIQGMLVFIFLLGGIIIGMVMVINAWKSQQRYPQHYDYPQRQMVVAPEESSSPLSGLILFIVAVLLIGGTIMKPYLDQAMAETSKTVPNEQPSPVENEDTPAVNSSVSYQEEEETKQIELPKTESAQAEVQPAELIPTLEHGSYYIQVSNCNNREEALKSRRAWHGVGSKQATILEMPNGSCKVLIGAFRRTRKAEEFMEIHNIKGFVVWFE